MRNVNRIPFPISNAEIMEVVNMAFYRAAVDTQLATDIESEASRLRMFHKKTLFHILMICCNREYDKIVEDGISSLITGFFWRKIVTRGIKIPDNLRHYDRRRLTDSMIDAT